ncbi:MAG: cryptochrome/photolyase family protein [Pararhodobacter sp.]
MAPLILWFRRDLRLDDNPMLVEAAATGRPLLPVFIADEAVTGIGAAARWRWGEAVATFEQALRGRGLRLILRRGKAAEVLQGLIAETGASGVWWGRLYDPQARARDAAIKRSLRAAALEARSFPGHLLLEPWQLATAQGGHFKVYTPFWKALSAHEVPAPAATPANLRPAADWPASDRLDDWRLGAAMQRGAAVVARHACIGEAAAAARLERFMAHAVEEYRHARDLPGRATTSGLSENLTYGEIGPRRIWAQAQMFMAASPGHRGAEHFCKELVWREFAWHLMFHTPHIAEQNWRPEWNGFPWRDDNPDAERWRRGLTGEPFVDAGLREMYVTGTMHNRARMIVASYLTKHLMTHWKVGLDWFADCLIDWDPAANAMGWQWVAGSGPDAAPYFRIFNPATQAAKFDPDGSYCHAFIAELSRDPPQTARAYFDAVPRGWRLDGAARYPAPLVDLAEGRARALAAYAQRAKG